MTDLLPGPADALVFGSAVLLCNATPGVDFLLTATRTLQGGAWAGVAAALGISTGCVVHALAAAFGLAALLVVHPQAFLAVQWAGAAYLVWIGLQMLRQAWRGKVVALSAAVPSAPEAGALAGVPISAPERTSSSTSINVSGMTPGNTSTPPRPWSADFRGGLLTNLLNPKVALFFLAFLPQFVPATSPHKTLSLLLMGAWFVLQGTLFLMLLVALASRAARLRTPAWVARALGALSGLLFVALALRLLKEKPVSA